MARRRDFGTAGCHLPMAADARDPGLSLLNPRGRRYDNGEVNENHIGYSS
ncbi:MAG TPA: hypothetical protein VIK18_20085 [Pirellulales bacterium]